MKVWVLERHWHEQDEYEVTEELATTINIYEVRESAEKEAEVMNALVDTRYDDYVASVERENKEAEEQLELARKVIQGSGLLTRHLQIGREYYTALEKWEWRIENNEGWYKVTEQEVL